ncbi:molecular chaperone [Paenibacillus sp. SYP-B4298]|uniref:molecular chaperone n=1 Tax=Paenibacillus sp. SYP-B4298 TaxID=2996034 RepID=UPI0022DD39D2|nr:molecular chaperone [Paenibacillus sp. SYP-B4298]
MKGYTYRLYKQPGHTHSEAGDGGARYTETELQELTTFQLQQICRKEKLVAGLAHTLDREGLVRTILRYRNAEERRLIRTECEGGLERVQQTLLAYLNSPLPERAALSGPAMLVLWNGLKVSKRDGYHIGGGSLLGETNVLLVSEEMELCGIFNLVKEHEDSAANGESRYVLEAEGRSWRMTSNRHYSLLFFRKADSDYLYRAYYEARPQPPANLHYYKLPLAGLEIRELEKTEAVLAIDLGTSGTTAGAYLSHDYVAVPSRLDRLNGRIQLDAINYVRFPDSAARLEAWSELLPTVVSAEDCSGEGEPRLSFGHEALRALRRNSYGGQATVLRGMKRWVNQPDKEEELTDVNGQTMRVKRHDIMRAYLKYVIEVAEHQFKCRFQRLHLTSPVKLKTQYLALFSSLLPGYDIEQEHALDEGLAVLYNTIAAQIGRGSFRDGEEYQALVIDCGGGTTDLSSCRFTIEDDRIAYKLHIHATYENGDTNFGGNNITYRIMQYMKLAFAAYYSGQGSKPDMDRLLDAQGTDVYRMVDEHGAQAVYARFEAAYAEAERQIPTRYADYVNRTRDEYMRVRSNFYFLWEMAERMKEQFYQRTGMIRSRFHEKELQEDDLHVTAVSRWLLSVVEDGRFCDAHHYPDVVFNIREINRLIQADIYDIVRKFLEEFYRDGRLQQYSIIKLTGQSCRIDAFREALKEFVPGRSIEFRQQQEAGRVPDLKLACLRGAIRYLADRKAGVVEATITGGAPVIPYSVAAYTHSGQEQVLISSLGRMNQARGTISRPSGVGEIELFLSGSEGGVRRKYVYRSNPRLYKQALYEDIAAEYGQRIPQGETDAIANGEVKLFVYAGDNRWGFEAVPVLRQQEQLYVGPRQFFAFESEQSELDFFDGLK